MSAAIQRSAAKLTSISCRSKTVCAAWVGYVLQHPRAPHAVDISQHCFQRYLNLAGIVALVSIRVQSGSAAQLRPADML